MGILNWEKEEFFMREALTLGKKAETWGDVPVGCVVVQGDRIVGRGENRRELNCDATAHAEIIAIGEACKNLGRWRLEDCSLYVTLEPCSMCTGGIINAKIHSVYFGAWEEKTGCCGSVIHLPSEPLGHKPQIYGGILQEDCKKLLVDFFQKKR